MVGGGYIDLAIRGRDFLLFRGHLGCGKTTTICMIGGLEDPTGDRMLVSALAGEQMVVAKCPRTFRQGLETPMASAWAWSGATPSMVRAARGSGSYGRMMVFNPSDCPAIRRS